MAALNTWCPIGSTTDFNSFSMIPFLGAWLNSFSTAIFIVISSFHCYFNCSGHPVFWIATLFGHMTLSASFFIRRKSSRDMGMSRDLALSSTWETFLARLPTCHPFADISLGRHIVIPCLSCKHPLFNGGVCLKRDRRIALFPF